MKKRIGTKLYDTASSELIADTDHGQVFRKRTRGREWFCVSDGQLEPLDESRATAILGEETFKENQLPEIEFTWIRVDRKTHGIISQKAKEDGVSITEEVRRIIEKNEF